MRRLAAIGLLGGLLLAAGATTGTAAGSAGEASLEKTVRFLQEAQLPSGGFAAAGEPSQITSAWSTLALAAAGINPRNQRRQGGVDAHSHLAANYRRGIEESECDPVACTTTLERELMVVNTAGTDPHDFGGVDLVAELLARARPDGSFPHVPGGQPGVNDTIFAVFALAPIAEPAARGAVGPAAEWIESVQHANGGWAWGLNGREEVDMTGAAIQALIAAGRGRNEAVEAGAAYLRGAQNPDGGFAMLPGEAESNAASTAWATQAIWAIGENAEEWRTGSGLASEDPLAFMESLQEPDGRIRWKRSQDLNGIWMTAYCSVAIGGHVWPIPEASYVPEQPPAQPPRPGEGEGSQSGAGVIAGGGGRGAPLFSRPKPGSRGRTPGGARTLRDGGARARDHSESRRGENAVQPGWTQSAEGAAAPQSAEPSAAGIPASGVAAGGGGGSGAGNGSGPGAGEVSGAVIGALGAAAERGTFGAPGLDGAGVRDGDRELAAIGIGSLAALLALGGAGWERRRQEAIL